EDAERESEGFPRFPTFSVYSAVSLCFAIGEFRETPGFSSATTLLYKYRQVPGSHTNDTIKHETGLLNQYRARRNTLRRRGIRGFENFWYLLFFLIQYFDDTRRVSRRWGPFLLFSVRALQWLDNRLHIRTAGKLRRQ
ncbi:MAG: hypothetical protein ACKV2V_18985, partial [Blastocatellia bacterium]